MCSPALDALQRRSAHVLPVDRLLGTALEEFRHEGGRSLSVVGVYMEPVDPVLDDLKVN